MFANGLSPDRRRIAVNLFVAMLLIGAVALGLGYRLALAQLEGSGQPWLIILPMAISLLVAMLMLARHLARLITSSPVKAPDRECLPADQTRVDEENQRALYLRATLDNLPFLFWLKDTQSRFLAVNKRFADACGKPSPESVVGLTDFDVWPVELAERYCADDKLVMNLGQEKSVEEPVAGGSDAGWIETFKKPVRAEDGTILGTVGFARDISERIFMQRALQESEERWALAVKGANDGIWDWNPKKGTVYFSNRWKSMLGYAPDEIGDAFEEWHGRIHPDDLAGVDAALARHLSGADAFYQCEYRLRCKGGGYTWVSDRGQAQFDAAGQPLRMAGSLTDVTARREAEARIQDRNQQLNAIFDLSPDGFVSFDAEHRVKYASPAFLRMTGIEEGQLAGLDETEFDRWLAKLCIDPAIFPGLAVLRGLELGDDKEKEKNAKAMCHELRTDGKSVDIDGDYTETLARLKANPQAIGVFGLSFYENNTDKLQVATMNGIVPTVETIAAGDYPVSRPLYFYVKKAHIGVIPGLKEYIEFFVSDEMAGPDGPLAEYGLVSDPELAATQAAVAAETPMGPLE